jgi:glutaredoxin
MAVLALVVVVAALMVRAIERRPIRRSPAGLAPGVVLVTGRDCGLCGPARRALDSAGVPYREVDIDVAAPLGVRSLPTLLVIGTGGEVVMRRSGRSAISGAHEAVAWGS